MSNVFIAPRVLLSVIFVAAGGAKLIGVRMVLETFDTMGWGRWFRYLTAFMERGAAAMLWIPVLSVLGSGMLFATMICGALFHVFVIGPSAVPALFLAILCGVMFWIDRARLALFMARLGFV